MGTGDTTSATASAVHSLRDWKENVDRGWEFFLCWADLEGAARRGKCPPSGADKTLSKRREGVAGTMESGRVPEARWRVMDSQAAAGKFPTQME